MTGVRPPPARGGKRQTDHVTASRRAARNYVMRCQQVTSHLLTSTAAEVASEQLSIGHGLFPQLPTRLRHYYVINRRTSNYSTKSFPESMGSPRRVRYFPKFSSLEGQLCHVD